MKSLLNYFVRSIRYHREKKIRCLSEQKKVKVVMSTINRVGRLKGQINTLTYYLDCLKKGQLICIPDDEYIKQAVKKAMSERCTQLQSMLNEILIQEYDRKDNKAADC